jgi:hypothetical protein
MIVFNLEFFGWEFKSLFYEVYVTLHRRVGRIDDLKVDTKNNKDAKLG